MANMCKGFLSTLVRAMMAFVALFGAALIVYSIFFAIKAHSFGAPSGVALALGGIDLFMGLVLLTCGYRTRFFLRLFLLVNGLLVIGEIVVCVLFAIPSQQDTIIARMDLDGDVKQWVTDNIKTTTYIFAAVIAMKVVAVAVVVLQLCAMREGFDEGKYLPRGGKKDALLANKDAESAEAAFSRYREKNSSLYEKYGIKQ
jgi:hypothetical protein